MSVFEEKHIYPLIKNNSAIYLHYIDYIFIVWTKSRYKMSGTPAKNHGKKPQRNLTCNKTQKRRYMTERNAFLPGLD